ncbi:MAG: ATP-binding protein [Cyanobacteria bacterium P01_E01_bin.42]
MVNTVERINYQKHQSSFQNLQGLQKVPFSPELLPLYDRIFTTIGEAIAISDLQQPNSPLIYCNKAFEKMTGYSRSEAIGKSFFSLQGQETEENTIVELRKTIREGRECRTKLKANRKNSKELWSELTLFPLVNEQGDLTHYLSVQKEIAPLREEKFDILIEQERLLGNIARRIQGNLNLQEILNFAVEEVREILQCDRVIFYRFNPGFSGTVVAESVGMGWKQSLDANVTDNCFTTHMAELYQKGRVRAIDDIYDAGLTECHIKLLEDFEIKANLIIPVVENQQLWGLLIGNQCRGMRHWQNWEIELCEELSVQIAIAIRQAILFAELENELRERKKAEASLQVSEAKLREKAQSLEGTLEELKQTQAQLIQAEKMSGLGQLVAGISHELNNPVAFIRGNIGHAEGYSQSLLELVSLYQEYYPEPSREISDKIEEIECDFIAEDFPHLLESMQTGAKRIQDIVSSLRNFSRLDEADRKPVNLQEGLENALSIVGHRLQGQQRNIEVEKKWGNLPEIDCYAALLNQVFLNLLNNAIDALQNKQTAKEEEFTPVITVETKFIEKARGKDLAVIRIWDNGTGIPPEIQQRIFDPFFTTKPVGQGTGMGLSTAYQIVVQQHGGRLYSNSQPGERTVFTVEIPYQEAR